MKCRFKTDKILIAAKETKHTITTTEGKLIHKKLASKPLKFQPSKKPDETRKPTMRCKRCGRFSNGDLCYTHKRLYNKQDDQKTSTSGMTFPTTEGDTRRHHDINRQPVRSYRRATVHGKYRSRADRNRGHKV